MNAKLTLSIEKEVIEQTKIYAKKQDRSLSKLVETFLRVVSASEKKEVAQTFDSEELHPITKSLRGAFKVPDDFDYDEVLREMKEKRFREKGLL